MTLPVAAGLLAVPAILAVMALTMAVGAAGLRRLYER